MDINTRAEQTTLSRRIGLLLRQKRIMAGLSQDAVANAIGVTFQQVQKYEKGINRISIPLAIQLSRVIGFPVTQLLCGEEGVPEDAQLSRRHLEAIRELITLDEAQLPLFKAFMGALRHGH